MGDLLDFSSQPLKPAVASTGGRSADPFGAFVPFSSSANNQPKTLAQQQAMQQQQQQQQMRPAPTNDLFGSLAQGVGASPYKPATPQPQQQQVRPAAQPVQQHHHHHQPIAGAGGADPFGGLLGNTISKPRPMNAPAAGSTGGFKPAPGQPMNTAQNNAAGNWNFDVFEASSSKTVVSPPPTAPTSADDDPFAIFNSKPVAPSKSPAPASDDFAAFGSATSQAGKGHDDFGDFAAFTSPAPSAPAPSAPAPSVATTDDIFAAFEQPAAPKSSNTGTPLTPPSASSSSASLPPPKTTFTAEHNQQFEFAEDEDEDFYQTVPKAKPASNKTSAKPSTKPQQPQRQQQTDDDAFDDYRESSTPRRPASTSSNNASSSDSGNLLGSMGSMFGKLKETAAKATESAMKIAAETSAQVKKALDDKLKEEESKRVPQHLVRMLVDMGASPDEARNALVATRNDATAAIKFLKLDPTKFREPELVDQSIAQPQPQHSQPKQQPQQLAKSVSPQSTEYDSEVARLVEMGFDAVWAQKAIVRANGDYDVALDLLTKKGNVAKSTPSPPPQAQSPPVQQQTPKLSPETKVAKLVEMGFNAQWAAKALERTNGDVSEAAQLLLSKGPAAKSPPVLSSNKAAPAAAVANGSRSSTPGSSSSSSSLPRTVSPAPIVKATATSKPKLNAPPLDPQVESKSNELRLKGNDLFKAGDYAAAKALYTDALDLIPKGHPATLPLLGNRAQCSLSADSFKPCIEDCNAVLALVPDDVKSLMRRAKANEAIEKLDDAFADYKLALSIDPSQKNAGIGMDRITKTKKSLEKHLEKEASGETYNPHTAAAAETSTSSASLKSHEDELADLYNFSSSKPSSSASNSGPAQAASAPIPESEQGEALKKLKAREAQEKEAQDAKDMFQDEVDRKLSAWRSRKDGNIRALLSSLDSILWPELEWTTINLSELVTAQQVKIRYMKAINKVHPDKVNTPNLEHKMLAQGVFYTLNQAWDIFKVQNNL